MPEHPYSIDEARTLATQGIPTFTECSFDASVIWASHTPKWAKAAFFRSELEALRHAVAHGRSVTEIKVGEDYPRG